MCSPTRRTLLRGALGLGAATALTACGGGSTTARTSGDVTLSPWTHDPGYEDFFFVQSVPDSVLEAARIDGASAFRIFRTIVLPLLRPSLGALAVRQSQQRQYDLVLAGAVIAMVPAVALFVVLRKQLLEGLSTGAVKG